MTGITFYGKMKRKLSFSATNTQGGFGVKRRMPIPKITSGPHSWTWRAAGCAGFFFVTQHFIDQLKQLNTQLTNLTWVLGSDLFADIKAKKEKPARAAALQDQE